MTASCCRKVSKLQNTTVYWEYTYSHMPHHHQFCNSPWLIPQCQCSVSLNSVVYCFVMKPITPSRARPGSGPSAADMVSSLCLGVCSWSAWSAKCQVYKKYFNIPFSCPKLLKHVRSLRVQSFCRKLHNLSPLGMGKK